MNIQIERKNDSVYFVAKNEHGNEVHIDGSPAIGGEDKGARPMELILMSVGSCAAIDVVSILKKQKQDLQDLKIEVKGERVDEIPAVFKDIKVVFHAFGNLDEEKVKRAVDLSFNKYCSVSKMLKPTVNMTFEYKIN